VNGVYAAIEVRIYSKEGETFDAAAAMEAVRLGLAQAIPTCEIETEVVEFSDGQEPEADKKPFPQELIDLPCTIEAAEEDE
jgi:hypothetical protein